MSSDLLVELLQSLDEPQHHYAYLHRYAAGRQPLAYLSPEAKIALPSLNRIVSNIPDLAVCSLAERLRVAGFNGADVWADWLHNNLDQSSAILHREALTFGNAYVIVWGANGLPLVTVESPRQVAVINDPATRAVTSAVKRWTTKATTEAMVYLPDRIEHWRASTTEAASSAFDLIEMLENPLGVVPVVDFCNQRSILGRGHSEIEDLIPLVDGLNKALADLAVAQEYCARPRRWATGLELVEVPKLDQDGNPVTDDDGDPVMETVNPIPEGNRMMVSENDGAKFGQLPAADLRGFDNSVNIWLGQIMAVSALPAHMIGVWQDNPASADALRASEASLTARAEARQAVFGKSWEQVARLIVAIRDGIDVDAVDVSVQWGDPGSRSIAQQADAVTKLFQVGLLSRSGALERLGYSQDEIEAELRNIAAEADASADPTMKRYFDKQFNAGDI